MKWKATLVGIRPTKAAVASALRSTHRTAAPNRVEQPLRAAYHRMRKVGASLNDADVQGTRRMHPPVPMATLQRHREPRAVDGEASERERRLRVLQDTFGMWKGRDDIAKDGLQYQIEARAEWD